MGQAREGTSGQWRSPRPRLRSRRSSNNSSILSPSSPEPMTPSGKSVKGPWHTSKRKPIFDDKESVKRRVRAALLKKTYDVKEFYHTSGLWQQIARHPYFDIVSFFLVATNAVWLAIDADYNQATVQLEAEPLYQIVENLFCLLFSFEWLVRFLSFKRKLDGLRDVWFTMDSFLVGIMVVETWLVGIFLLIFSRQLQLAGLQQSSTLRVFRLVRLVRLARIARLFRLFPEVLILVKGMLAAVRSVGFTLVLLVVVLYVFAITFTEICAGTDVGHRYFSRIPQSMYHLLMYGVFLDSIGAFVDELSDAGFFIAALFLIFVFLAAFTLMNMLIGVLCEVVSSVAESEREHISVSFVKEKLQSIVMDFAKNDGDESEDTINKQGFVKLLDDIDAIRALHDVGVDPENLVDLADVIFDNQEGGDRESCLDKRLSFCDFMEIVLQFRGTNTATVKDVVNLQKNFRKMTDDVSARFDLKFRLLNDDMCDIANALNIPRKTKEVKDGYTISKITCSSPANHIKGALSTESDVDRRSSGLPERPSHFTDSGLRFLSELAGSPTSEQLLRNAEVAPLPPDDPPPLPRLSDVDGSIEVIRYEDPGARLEVFRPNSLCSVLSPSMETSLCCDTVTLSKGPESLGGGLEAKMYTNLDDSASVIEKVSNRSSNARLQSCRDSSNTGLEVKMRTSSADTISVIDKVWIWEGLGKAYADLQSGLDRMQLIISELQGKRGEHVASPTFGVAGHNQNLEIA